MANLAGFPAIVQDTDYHSALGVSVTVRNTPLYTTVTVNGVDVYFHRLSGRINGVALTPASEVGATEPLPVVHFGTPAPHHS